MGKILRVIILIIFIVAYNISYAQSITTVKGRVVNSQNNVLSGNALIISKSDSTIIKGTSFFESKFELTYVNEKNILLKLTSLEFADTFIPIHTMEFRISIWVA